VAGDASAAADDSNETSATAPMVAVDGGGPPVGAPAGAGAGARRRPGR